MSRLVVQSTNLKSVVTRQIVSEFREKMKRTEDLIAKLGHSLRELHPNESLSSGALSPARPLMSAKIAQFFKRK